MDRCAKHKGNLYCTMQTLSFACAAFLFWDKGYFAHLHFQEQFQMFQFSWHYFFETVALPGGLGHYLSRFLVQFFYHATAGAAAMASLLTAVQLATALHLRFLPSGNRWVWYPLSFVPAFAVWCFLLNTDAMPALGIALLAALLLAYACKHIRRTHARRCTAIATGFLLFVGFGGGSLVFFLLTAAWEAQLSFRKKRDYGEAFVAITVGIALFFAVPVIGLYLYNYPYDQLLVSYGTYRYPLVNYAARPAALFFTLLAVSAFQILPSTVGKKNMTAGIAFLTLFLGGGWMLYTQVDGDEERVLRYNHWARTEQWDKISEQARQKKPTFELEQCCVNLALAKQGKLCDRMFSYPAQSRQALLPDCKLDCMTPMVVGEAYFQLGFVNTAQRFAFEAQEAIPDYQKSARCYKRLAVTNIVNGNYPVAAQYLRTLENTLYYRDWAVRMEPYLHNDSLTEADPLLGWMRNVRLQENFFFDERQVAAALILQLKANQDNKTAWQYLFAICLLNKQIAQIADIIPLYMQQYPQARLPVHVQEALLLWWAQKTKQMEDTPWKIEEQVKTNLKNFLNAAHQSPETARRMVKKYYSNTFWGYAYEHQNTKQ